MASSTGSIDVALLWGEDCVLDVAHLEVGAEGPTILPTEWPAAAIERAHVAALFVASPSGPARARLEAGDGLYVLASAGPDRTPPVPRSRPEPSRYAWTAAAAVAHGWLLALVFLQPPRMESLSLDLLDASSHTIVCRIAPLEPLLPWSWDVRPPEAGPSAGERHDPGSLNAGLAGGRRADGRSGARGDRVSDARSGAGDLDVRVTGVLGALAAGLPRWGSGAFGAAGAFGGEAASAGVAAEPAGWFGGGGEAGASFGFGGIGPHGTGIGCGHMLLPIAAGPVARDADAAIAPGTLGGRRLPTVIACPAPYVIGTMPREVIRRVVRRHRGEVASCYEDELQHRPDLAGRVEVSFVIDSTGYVTSSVVSDSTLRNRRVESCIAGAVRRWPFPASDGGGLVAVRYPFVLEPAR